MKDGKVVSFERYHQDKKIDKIILISPYGLGDTMNLCGFKDALEKKHNASIHFIIKPTHEIVMKMYGIKDYSFQTFDKNELRAIAQRNTEVKKGEYFVAHPQFIGDDGKLLEDFYNFKISFVDIFKKTFWLSDDVQFKYPTIPPVLSNEFREKVEKIAPLNKVILFSPEAFSTNKVVPDVLENEVKKLTDKGFVVISNVIDKHETIKGSVYLPLTIDEAVALGINCAGVLSVRSGFTDIIVPFLKETVIYYPNIETLNLYSLSYLKDKNIKEIVAPDTKLKKIGPCFQIEKKSNENLFRFCITLFRKKERRDSIKYCVFGIQIWVIKKIKNCRKHLLFGLIPIYKEKL